MNAENKDSCSQRDSAEREGYVRAHRSFNRIWNSRDEVCRASAMRTILFCWQKVSGHPRDYWNPV